MGHKTQTEGTVSDAKEFNRTQMMARLWGDLVRAVRELRVIAVEKLQKICRMFRFKTSHNRAMRLVAKYYSANQHPLGMAEVPAVLLEAFAVVGKEEFVRAKELGDAIRTHSVLTEAQVALGARISCQKQRSDSLPRGRDFAETRYFRTSSMRPLYGFPVMPAMA